MASVHASPRILIVGQGLAGTAVAWSLWKREIPFLIVDPELEVTSSKLAAGLITPITGIRVKKSWKLEELQPFAEAFYQELEIRLKQNFYRSCSMLRFFKNELERERWQKRSDEEEYASWIGKADLQTSEYPAWIDAPLGGFEQNGAAWLDTHTYLEASRDFFKDQASYSKGEVEEQDLVVSEQNVSWGGEMFRHVVLARGWQQKDSRFFPWLDFNSARGVIADLELLEIPRAEVKSQVIHHHAWIQTRSDRVWRCGSTYEFDFNKPLESSLAEIEGKLAQFVKGPYRLTRAAAAVRPIIRHRSLVVGTHPVYPRVSLLNGLGSKGTLRAPWFAEMLCREILEGIPVDREVEIR